MRLVKVKEDLTGVVFDRLTVIKQAEAKYFGEFAPQRHLFKQYKINVNGGDSNDSD